LAPKVLWLLLWINPKLREREVDGTTSGPPLLNALSLIVKNRSFSMNNDFKNNDGVVGV
tara:strand:- start:1476 stop:1652 length:177 start_codon:yes stop_codon:yes gene_type:complete